MPVQEEAAMSAKGHSSMIRDVMVRLRSAIAERGWREIELERGEYQVARLTELNVNGVEAYARKLLRAARSGAEHEFRGFLTEGFYALKFADAGATVQLEPLRGAGPDMRVTMDDDSLFVEIKRITLTETGANHDVSEWSENEANPRNNPVGPPRPSERLLSTIRAAERQLVDGAMNLVVVHDFSLEITRSHFLDVTKEIERESSAGGTHRKLSAVFYHSNFSASSVPGPEWLWVSPLHRLTPPIDAVIRSALLS